MDGINRHLLTCGPFVEALLNMCGNLKIFKKTFVEVVQLKKKKTLFVDECKTASLKQNVAYKSILNRKTRAFTELYRELRKLEKSIHS